jgi:two-component system sensor histidine kinase TctE
MTPMGRNSLRLKLALWLLAPLLLLLAFDAYLTHRRATAASNAAFDRVLFSSAKQIQEGIRVRDGRIEVDIPYAAFDLFEATSSGRVFYRVSEENGAHLTGYEDLPLPRARQDLFRPSYYDTIYRGEPVRAVAFRMPVHDLGGTPVRTVWVAVAETPDTRNVLARDILLGSVVQETVLVGLALTIFVIAGIAILRPIHRLSRAVASRSEEQPSPLSQEGMPGELRPLVDALNGYTRRMQDMLQARRRFFDDAAHQLKTPLAVMRAQLELAAREALSPHVRERIESALGTLTSASDGVDKLLSLARLEPDSGRLYTLRHSDIASIARSVCLDWAPIARANGVDLGFEAEEEPVVVEAEPVLLQELLGNLIDNAVRYAGAGSHVTVRVSGGQRPRWDIVDDGPGVADEDKSLVLKRFYRVPGTAPEGTGLGLAIVREIARVHDASLALDNTPGGGLTVTVSFPWRTPL